MLSHRSFTALKYVTYALLSINVLLFFQQELLAFEHTFASQFGLSDLIQAFSATIDTGAWVILLLLFELETSVIPDEKIRGWVRRSLHGVRGLCYVFIVYAGYGYLVELATLYRAELLPATTDACAMVGQGWSKLIAMDEYEQLSELNCAALGGDTFRLLGFDILAAPAVLQDARWLAWVDVINAATWILVVIVLEIDVLLQLRGRLQGRALLVSKALKFMLYPVLFLAAVYWGIAGDFLDFWDASLWLFAFVFIELNIFEWQAETHD